MWSFRRSLAAGISCARNAEVEPSTSCQIGARIGRKGWGGEVEGAQPAQKICYFEYRTPESADAVCRRFKVQGKTGHVVVDAEDALIAALKG